MLEIILSKANMTAAYYRVKENGGACGIDGMKASELQSYLNHAWSDLKPRIMAGIYVPQAVKRVEIPKPNGGVRLLGIPTVFDRMLQQAIHQVLHPLWESTFSEHSYGFRPNRNCHQAVSKALTYVNTGLTHIVDIDLEKFFDRVNHDYLMHLLGKRIGDKRVLSLIGKYLRSGVMLGGIFSKTEEGTPQGSPLSPLLSNIVLDVMDKELESRGHKFVRYADDFSIYCRSKRGATRVFGSISKFINEVLHLQINKLKSGIRRPSQMLLLGFGFHIKTKGNWGIRISPKSIVRMKDKVRQLTQRKQPYSMEYRLNKIYSMQSGWFHYYKIADCKVHLERIDEWTRSRLRMCEWKLWKRIKTRIKRLMSLGVSPEQSYQWANTRKGYWRIAHSPILTTSLTNNWFKQQGYVSLTELYKRHKARS